jgi:DNA-binding MarR family transcriptional regulator
MQSTSKWMKRHLGLTGPQRMVVRLVGSFPGISAGDLAKHLRLHPSTLTGVLARLVEGGFVLRKADARDGRRALFFLSKKGERANLHQEGTVEWAVGEMLQKTPPTTTRAAEELLSALTVTLNAPRRSRAS